MKVLFILLALAALKFIWLYKVYSSVPAAELKRRALAGDRQAARLYKVAAYGATLDLLLWLAGTAAAASLTVWSARTAWWLAVIVVVVISWLVFAVRLTADGWSGRLAAYGAPFGAWLLDLIAPVFEPLAKRLPTTAKTASHTGLYEKKDLLGLLKRQARQADSRIDEQDLRLALSALSFGDKTAGEVMTPRRRMKFVGAAETAGPMLMDELHQTGFSRFPVVKDSPKAAAPKVIGTLYLKDIVGAKDGGKVRDFIRKDVEYISEDAGLRLALEAFSESGQLLLIVTNNFDETVGMLSLEDVLGQITGRAAKSVAK